jgi:hypothetical protein
MLSRAASAAGLLCLSTLLAGCGASPDLVPGGDGGGEDLALGGTTLWTYASSSAGAPPYVRDYSGLADHPKDPNSPDLVQGIPGGPAQGPVQTCCLFTWVRAPDLFEPGQLSVLRVTLNWTNTQTDQANLDVALCVSWYCGFPEMPDQTNVLGAHSESFDLISGGREEFGGWYGDGVPTVGARYSNGVFSAGVPYTIHVDVVPIADALAFVDPHEVVVPPNATLQAELAGPLRGTGLSAGLMVYGSDDRPLAYHLLEGDDGSVHDLGHGEGTYVVAPFVYDGAFARLKVNATTEPKPLRVLEETFAEVEVAVVPDAAEHGGTFDFAAPPGSLDTFPFFVYDSAAGQVPGASGSSAITLRSSSGVIAQADLAAVGVVTPAGQMCLTCNTATDWEPANYLDDDGTYQVDYSSSGASGRFILFTATYSR